MTHSGQLFGLLVLERPEGEEEFSEEDLVAHQDVVVTLSTHGYVKRLPLDTYRAQRRGGLITGESRDN